MGTVLRTAQITNVQLVETGINAATAAPSAATNGVLVPDGLRGEVVHLLVGCSNSVNVRPWGMTFQNQWYIMDTFTMTIGANQAEPLQFAGGYQRVTAQVTGIQTTQLGANVGFGFGG